MSMNSRLAFEVMMSGLCVARFLMVSRASW